MAAERICPAGPLGPRKGESPAEPRVSRSRRWRLGRGRDRRRRSLAIVILAAVLAAHPDVSPAADRKTLFDWNWTGIAPDQPELDTGGPEQDTGGQEQVEPLETDRPDFTEASSTVGRDVLQIEGGYTFTKDRSGGAGFDQHSFGEVLFRWGTLADWLELRLGVFPIAESVFGPGRGTQSGVEDLYLGTKIALTEQQGFLPEMGILPQTTVPSGSGGFSNNRVLPGLNWLYSWEVNKLLSVGASTQFNQAVDGQTFETYTEWAQSLTVGYTLSEQYGAYTEWYALFPQDAHSERVEHYFDTGLTYRPNKDVQFDVRIGVGLNEAADDLFAGAGLSLRFR
jgi:hypothetical protein